MRSSSYSIKRICGIVAVVTSLALIVAFVLSEAWFGVLLALFVGVVGMQIVMQPDEMLRAGGDDDEVVEDFQDRFRNRD